MTIAGIEIKEIIRLKKKKKVVFLWQNIFITISLRDLLKAVAKYMENLCSLKIFPIRGFDMNLMNEWM